MGFGASYRFRDDEAGNLTAANVNTLDKGGNVFSEGAGLLTVAVSEVRYISTLGSFDFGGAAGVAIPPSTLNVAVYLTIPGNVLTVNPGGFPAGEHLPLAEVDTSGTEVIAIRDRRHAQASAVAGAPPPFGDVTGPAGATPDAVALFDGATGKLLKDSGAPLASANGVATLNGSTLVVQNPANAQTTPAAAKIPISSVNGKANAWVDPYVIVYRPGDVSGNPNVYTDWPSAVAAVNAPEIVQFERRLVCVGDLGALSVPAGFATAFAGPGNVRLSGMIGGVAGTGAADVLTINDGATFTPRSLRHVENSLILNSVSTAPVVTVAAGTHVLYFERGASLRNQGTAPFWQVNAGIVFFTMNLGGQFLVGGAQPVVNLAVGAVFAVQLFNQGTLQAGAYGGPVGSVAFVSFWSDAVVLQPQNLFLGTQVWLANTRRALLGDAPAGIIAAPYTFSSQDTGGLIQQGGAVGAPVNLPPANEIQQRRIFVNNLGPNVINYVPAGADMIETSGGPVATLPIPVGAVITLQAVTVNRWAEV